MTAAAPPASAPRTAAAPAAAHSRSRKAATERAAAYPPRPRGTSPPAAAPSTGSPSSGRSTGWCAWWRGSRASWTRCAWQRMRTSGSGRWRCGTCAGCRGSSPGAASAGKGGQTWKRSWAAWGTTSGGAAPPSAARCCPCWWSGTLPTQAMTALSFASRQSSRSTVRARRRRPRAGATYSRWIVHRGLRAARSTRRTGTGRTTRRAGRRRRRRRQRPRS
mmetsp:Transcript_15095/g.38831  ORF Transcript_15095/g.38831 Transcript_15095/m.38831 type:complete len:219 (-) Transcript_15095:305-961(-)